MFDLPTLDIRCLGWGDLLLTGIEERQLRSAMVRNLIKLGVKRKSRMYFSLREYFIADVIRALDAAWVPIGVACTVATMIAPDLEKIMSGYLANGGGDGPAGHLRLAVAKAEGGVGLAYLDHDKVLPDGTAIPVAALFHAMPSMVTIALDLLVARLVHFIEDVQSEDEDEAIPDEVNSTETAA